MAVRTQTAAEIRSGRVGPRGRWLRENLEVAAEPAEPTRLPSLFATPARSRVTARSRVSIGGGTHVAVARVTATTSFASL